MEDDVVVVAALGEGGEVVAGLKREQRVSVIWQEGKRWGLSVSHREIAYLGGMVIVEFDGYGALGEVSKICVRHGKLSVPWWYLGRRW